MTEIHASDFECVIDGGNDGSTASDQELPTGPNTTYTCDLRAGSITCNLHSLKNWLLFIPNLLETFTPPSKTGTKGPSKVSDIPE